MHTDNTSPPSVGARLLSGGRCTFTVWGPDLESLELVDCAGGRAFPMSKNGGYWHHTLDGVGAGFTYRFRINGSSERPDPASQWQPDGVHGPSAVVDHTAFAWRDEAWRGIPLEKMIVYELHTGTFSPDGTFDGVIDRLGHLCDLGITAVEIMPVAQFPGVRNWGYDGVCPFAVQASYGGVDGLKRLVDACHRNNLAVILDVVYNHLGPEGNYLWEYGPYFTKDKYRTPWGWAVNFDDAHSDDVRAYFIANALHWFEKFHIDVLRLDAVHAIYDLSARPFLEELGVATEEFSRGAAWPRRLIAESDLNDPRVIRPRAEHGMGLDAQWSDDLHHGMHALLTGERIGYYGDFGSAEHVARALSCGYTYAGDYSSYRKRRHGAPPEGLPSTSFLVCSQNHDQVGNRMLGDRLASIAGPEATRLAAAAVLLSPCIPLLFMGEEWGETRPFMYFVNHGDEGLSQAVREGRKREFEAFHRAGECPDPTISQTFDGSRPDWGKLRDETHARFFAFYRRLIDLRKTHPVFSSLTFEGQEVRADGEGVVTVLRRVGTRSVFSAMNFSEDHVSISMPRPGSWVLLVDSGDAKWGGGEYSVLSAGGETVSLPPCVYAAYEQEFGEKSGKES